MDSFVPTHSRTASAPTFRVNVLMRATPASPRSAMISVAPYSSASSCRRLCRLMLMMRAAPIWLAANTLERDGMVTRKVHPTIPPQVEYGLTPLGRSLALPLMQLATWVLDHL